MQPSLYLLFSLMNPVSCPHLSCPHDYHDCLYGTISDFNGCSTCTCSPYPPIRREWFSYFVYFNKSQVNYQYEKGILALYSWWYISIVCRWLSRNRMWKPLSVRLQDETRWMSRLWMQSPNISWFVTKIFVTSLFRYSEK